ncbi:DUF2568 domain-containing protein [Streptomyces sp. KL110A]|uniref:DUF2568 domain-containing protein n=1 Tax=Streptomyces sp. KL110A TaxID=3384221 RepID=UPI0038C07DF7
MPRPYRPGDRPPPAGPTGARGRPRGPPRTARRVGHAPPGGQGGWAPPPPPRFPVPAAGVLVVKALVFGGAALALAGVGHGTAAVVFAVVAAVNTAMVTVSRRSGGGLAVR